MLHRKLRFQGQEVHTFEWNPAKNSSQIIKSPIGRRQPIQSFRHPWHEDRGRRIAMRVNLGFFKMGDPSHLHMGLLGRDSGFVDGVPNNGYEMWLNKDTLNIKQLNTVGVAGIGKNWTWATSLAYPLVKDGKKFLDPNVNGFNRAEKTQRTAFGQKADKTLVVAVAQGMDDNMTSNLMLHLGCVNAIMGDGGGSSQLMIEDQLVVSNSRSLGTVLAVFAEKGETVKFVDQTVIKSGGLIKLDMISSMHATNPTMKPIGLVVHTTANRNKTADALNHDKYYDNNSDSVSVHWTVDSKHAVQSVPENKGAWHAGNRDYNLTYIGMEICENNVVNNKLDAATYNNAVLLAADILNRNNLSIDKMIQHRDVPGREWKNCPNTELINWTKFKTDVQAKLTPQEIQQPDDTPVPLPIIQRRVAVEVEGQFVDQGYLIGNRTYVPILTVGTIFGSEVEGLGDRVNIKRRVK